MFSAHHDCGNHLSTLALMIFIVSCHPYVCEKEKKKSSFNVAVPFVLFPLHGFHRENNAFGVIFSKTNYAFLNEAWPIIDSSHIRFIIDT